MLSNYHIIAGERYIIKLCRKEDLRKILVRKKKKKAKREEG